MASPGGSPLLRLKDWLVAQVESGRYPGLRWEDRERRLFRIPWKHAAKQDYLPQQDAALFKAWAIYKGKYQAGREDRPSVWKTRLRCALNKSSDFQEVPERSHLDISEPYKVYRIVSDRTSPETEKENTKESQGELNRPPASAHPGKRAKGRIDKAERCSASGQESKEKPAGLSLAASPLGSQANPMPGPDEHQGYQVKGFFCSWNPAQFRCHRSPPFMGPDSQYTDAENINSDCWLHIRLFYCDVPVMEVTTRTAEGCRITFCPVRTDNAHLYGSSRVEQIQLPPPGVVLSGNSRARGAVRVLEQLLPHLHRGVLLWVAPEGVFMKRQCQGRVYWKGPLAPHSDQPNKLEREKTYKLLDTQQFLRQLRGYLSHGEPPPQYQIHLCFGEEYPAGPKQKLHKFIMAHVEPVFARDLFLHAQKLGPHLLQDSPVCSSETPKNIVWILKQLCSL